MCVYSCDQFFVIPWTVAHRLLGPWDFPSKNTGMSCHFLLQGIFLTQGSNNLSLVSPALTGRFFTNCATWEAWEIKTYKTHLGKNWENDLRLKPPALRFLDSCDGGI